MKDAKGHGSNARGGVSSQVNAINEWIKSIRSSAQRHANQPSVGTEPPTHDNLDAELAGRNTAERQREIDAQSTLPKMSDTERAQKIADWRDKGTSDAQVREGIRAMFNLPSKE